MSHSLCNKSESICDWQNPIDNDNTEVPNIVKYVTYPAKDPALKHNWRGRDRTLHGHALGGNGANPTSLPYVIRMHTCIFNELWEI